MSSESEQQRERELIIRRDGRYPVEAFVFLQEGMARAVKETYGEKFLSRPYPDRHVTGRQVCLSLRDLAVERWGFLARNVLDHWRIRATVDFGHMVYLMIDHGLMHKTDDDSLDDFRNVYTFDDAFAPQDCFEMKE